jgi:hypothetical protein
VRARKAIPAALAGVVWLLASWEALALTLSAGGVESLPTITETIQPLPGWAEVLILAPIWIVGLVFVPWHFGWLTKGDKPPFGLAPPRGVEPESEAGPFDPPNDL